MGLVVDVKKRFEGFTLDVSWEIGDELAVLFGFSGAGKSLTLRMIAGLMRPDAGLIRSSRHLFFDHRRHVDLSPRQRSLGYVFQDLALFPHMTVRENILAGGHGLTKAEREERAQRLMERFRLDGLADTRPSGISGGQKQRVAFARALLRRPDALLLDEPFSALDEPLRAEMRALLSDLQREFRIPVVLVTHDLLEALEVADHLIVCSNGRVVQSGTPREIVQHAAHPDVERLLKAACRPALSRNASEPTVAALFPARL